MVRTNLHCVCNIPTFTFPLMAVQTGGGGGMWLDKRQTFPSTSDKRLLNRPMWEVVPEAGKMGAGTAGCIFCFLQGKWDRVI